MQLLPAALGTAIDVVQNWGDPACFSNELRPSLEELMLAVKFLGERLLEELDCKAAEDGRRRSELQAELEKKLKQQFKPLQDEVVWLRAEVERLQTLQKNHADMERYRKSRVSTATAEAVQAATECVQVDLKRKTVELKVEKEAHAQDIASLKESHIEHVAVLKQAHWEDVAALNEKLSESEVKLEEVVSERDSLSTKLQEGPWQELNTLRRETFAMASQLTRAKKMQAAAEKTAKRASKTRRESRRESAVRRGTDSAAVQVTDQEARAQRDRSLTADTLLESELDAEKEEEEEEDKG